VYRVDGKRVEDSKDNSLLTNLGEIVNARGTEMPVLIIIDVRAPFSEVGKLFSVAAFAFAFDLTEPPSFPSRRAISLTSMHAG
jgi:hypothetical protein